MKGREEEEREGRRERREGRGMDSPGVVSRIIISHLSYYIRLQHISGSIFT
jgi:hypothetical protein